MKDSLKSLLRARKRGTPNYVCLFVLMIVISMFLKTKSMGKSLYTADTNLSSSFINSTPELKQEGSNAEINRSNFKFGRDFHYMERISNLLYQYLYKYHKTNLKIFVYDSKNRQFLSKLFNVLESKNVTNTHNKSVKSEDLKNGQKLNLKRINSKQEKYNIAKFIRSKSKYLKYFQFPSFLKFFELHESNLIFISWSNLEDLCRHQFPSSIYILFLRNASNNKHKINRLYSFDLQLNTKSKINPKIIKKRWKLCEQIFIPICNNDSRREAESHFRVERDVINESDKDQRKSHWQNEENILLENRTKSFARSTHTNQPLEKVAKANNSDDQLLYQQSEITTSLATESPGSEVTTSTNSEAFDSLTTISNEPNYPPMNIAGVYTKNFIQHVQDKLPSAFVMKNVNERMLNNSSDVISVERYDINESHVDESFWMDMMKVMSSNELQNKTLTLPRSQGEQTDTLGDLGKILPSVFHPSHCYTPPSCKQDFPAHVNTGSPKRSACRCDSLCERFGDCCDLFDETELFELQKSRFQYTIIRDEITCHTLPPPINHEAAYMIDRCTTNASSFLTERCSKQLPESEYYYLLDLPVVSSKSGILYANIFCAICHNETSIRPHTASLVCNFEFSNYDSEQLVNEFNYTVGTLTWRKVEEKEKKCALHLHFDPKYIRWCSKKLIDECSLEWSRKTAQHSEIIRSGCLSKNFFVRANSDYFRNPYCAICNGVNIHEIKCLETNITYITESPRSEISIQGLLRYSFNCQSNQLWDPISENCTTVYCDSSETSLNICDTTDKNSILKLSSVLVKSCKTIVRRSEARILYPNGTIYLRKPKLYFEYGEYEIVQDGWIKICVPDGRWTKPMKFLSTLLITISLICLALHMAIFIALPKRRNIPSMNLFSLSLALFASDLIFQCFFHYNKFSIFCKIFAALLYYFLCASFVWMNVMSIDIFRTFRSSTYKTKSKRMFVNYAFYAWVFPLFPTCLVVLVDRFANEDFYFIPDLGSDRCWFNNKWGHAAFFTIPAGTIVIINMILYGLSVWGIYKQRKLGKLASSSAQPGDKKNERNSAIKDRETSLSEANFSLDAAKMLSTLASTSPDLMSSSSSANTMMANSSTEKSNGSFKKAKILMETEIFFQQNIRDKISRRVKISRKHRLRLALYSKLALIMGMTWIFAFMSLHTHNALLDYLFVIFNGLQGTLIFFAFDCKKTVWNDLRERFGFKKLESFELSRNESRSFIGVGLYVHAEKLSFHYQTTNNKDRNGENGKLSNKELTSV